MTLVISPTTHPAAGRSPYGPPTSGPSSPPPRPSETPAVQVAISPEAARAAREAGHCEDCDENADPSAPKSVTGEPLSDEDVREVRRLAARDREVRQHEQAHKAAAAGYAGTIDYTYETGPDQRRYAVGGHVPIDMSEVPGDPAATVEKMQVIRRAALAPAEPSAQDRRVAAEAAQREAEARRALMQQRQADARDDEGPAATIRGRQFKTTVARAYGIG